jgi:hypothetical protein
MDDARLRELLGNAGRQRIQQAYDLGKSADHLAGIFQSRLGR